MPNETKKSTERERCIRRAGIRRGMRIALYEVQQMLDPLGVRLVMPLISSATPWTLPKVVVGPRRRQSASPAYART